MVRIKFAEVESQIEEGKKSNMKNEKGCDHPIRRNFATSIISCGADQIKSVSHQIMGPQTDRKS